MTSVISAMRLTRDTSAPLSDRKASPLVTDRVRTAMPATVRLTRGRDIAAACGQLTADTSQRNPHGHIEV